MKIFLDTANIDHIKHGVRLGVITGVTTNPTLVAKEGKKDYRETVTEICSVVPGPVSVEVIATDVDGMVREGKEINGWTKNVAVKIPATISGLEATARLAREGVKVNFTLCFSLNQALLAAHAGAAFVSPFVGRLDDVASDGMALVRDIVEVYKKYQLRTQVMAASIRHAQHVVFAASAGADVATIPYEVLLQMMKHPLTDAGLARFLEDWKKVMG